MSRGFLSYGAPVRKESWMHDSAVVKSRTLFIYMVYIVCECCRYSLIRPEKVPSAVALDAESNEVVQRSFTYAKKQVGVCSSQIPMFWSSISRFLLQASAILRPGEAISGFNRLQNLRRLTSYLSAPMMFLRGSRLKLLPGSCRAVVFVESSRVALSVDVRCKRSATAKVSH